MGSIEAAKSALGELFIMGFSGPELGPETVQFIRDAKIGGTIFFASNYESPAQMAELCNQIQSCRGDLPLWISVDHEGGKVQRFKKGFSRIPEAGSIAATGSAQKAFDVAALMARELRAVGVNVNFSPVADINTNPKNPVIGSRAYGDSEEGVSRMVSAVVRGHLTAGVQPCAKHFPGHGDTTADSHLSLPKVANAITVLRDREFKPFAKAFKSGCNFVMTAHILFPELDPDYPATLSKKILRPFLRDELRFKQIIVSDDMEMGAITQNYGAEDAPRLAIEAGCDLLIYRGESATRKAYAALTQALETGKLAPEVVLASAQRSRALKQEVLLPYRDVQVAEVMKSIATPEHEAILSGLLKA